MSFEPAPSQFSSSDFNNLIQGTEMLYVVGRRLSDSIARQPCEYLIQEASMAFVKAMMSLLGFLRFIPVKSLFCRRWRRRYRFIVGIGYGASGSRRYYFFFLPL